MTSEDLSDGKPLFKKDRLFQAAFLHEQAFSETGDKNAVNLFMALCIQGLNSECQ